VLVCASAAVEVKAKTTASRPGDFRFMAFPFRSTTPRIVQRRAAHLEPDQFGRYSNGSDHSERSNAVFTGYDCIDAVPLHRPSRREECAAPEGAALGSSLVRRLRIFGQQDKLKADRSKGA